VEAIIEKSSKIELIKQFSNLSIEKIVKEKTPSIGMLAKQYGEEVMQNVIGVVISDLNESFNGDLSRSNIEELIAEITTGFNRNITLEGIFITCKNLKYKNDTMKITLSKVLKAVINHHEEVMQLAMKLNYSDHLSKKESRDRPTQSAIDKEADRMARNMYLTGKLTKKEYE
jgi:hypothetical protein